METLNLDEERRGLLRRIVEGQAWRQLLVAHIRGHGLRLVTDLHDKQRLARDVEASLRQFGDLQAFYTGIDGGNLIATVRPKLERYDYPTARMELAVFLFLADRAERASMTTYLHSVADELASFARARLPYLRQVESPADDTFSEFCAEESQRPRAQQIFNSWLGVALLSLGRPGSVADARAVELGLRSRRCGDSVAEFLDGLRPFLDGCGLSFPAVDALGVQLPVGFE